MKTFIKTIKTITAVLMIIAGLLALFTIDNAQDITSLIGFVIVMVTGIAGGIYLLIYIYPELTDLSEFDGNTISMLEDYEREIEESREHNNSIFDEHERVLAELAEHNLLLLDRYLTFKNIIKTSKVIDDKNMENYPTFYRLIYEEDLVCGKNIIKGGFLDELDRFKEVYN